MSESVPPATTRRPRRRGRALFVALVAFLSLATTPDGPPFTGPLTGEEFTTTYAVSATSPPLIFSIDTPSAAPVDDGGESMGVNGTVGRDGTVWIPVGGAPDNVARLARVALDGTVTYVDVPSTTGRFWYLAPLPDGSIAAANFFDIHRISADGQTSEIVARPAASLDGPGVTDLDTDDAGNIYYVTDSWVSEDGIGETTTYSGPYGYWTETDGIGPAIVRVSLDGVTTLLIANRDTRNGPLGDLHEITPRSNGRIAFTAFNCACIKELHPDGTVTILAAINKPFSRGLFNVDGLVEGPDGTLYVWGDRQYLAVAADGTSTALLPKMNHGAWTTLRDDRPFKYANPFGTPQFGPDGRMFLFNTKFVRVVGEAGPIPPLQPIPAPQPDPPPPADADCGPLTDGADALTPPVLCDVVAGPGQFQAGWLHQADVRRWTLRYRLTPEPGQRPGPWTFVTVRAPALDEVVTGLRPGATYDVGLRAIGPDGRSPWSESAEVTVLAPDEVVDGPVDGREFAVEAVDETWARLTLPEVAPQPTRWTVGLRPAGAKQFVYQTIPGANVTQLMRLAPPGTFEFRVRPVFPDGTKGPWSDLLQLRLGDAAATPVDEALDGPVDVPAVSPAGAASALVEWNADTDPKRWHLRYTDRNGRERDRHVSGALRRTRLNGVDVGTANVRLRRIEGDGTKGPWRTPVPPPA